MHALVYHGPGQKAWEEAPEPVLVDGTDAIVRVDATTICGTDLHIRPCGRVANIGLHGHPATLHLEQLWSRDVTITTGLVDTYSTPTLLRLLGHHLHAGRFVTHHFPMHDFEDAYDTFARAADTGALKVVVTP